MTGITIVEKGQELVLRGKNTMDQVQVGLGWDPNEGQSPNPFDLDASLVARDAAGNAVEACYFGNKIVGEWGLHSGDNLTGQGDGDDEQIKVTLSKVPANITSIDVVVHIYKGAERNQTFAMVDNCYVQLSNLENPTVGGMRYDLAAADAARQTGLWFARIKRSGDGQWTFEAKGAFAPEYATLQSFSNQVLP